MQKPPKIPQLQKKLSTYLMGEDGRISKQNLLAAGAFLGSASLSALLLSSTAEAQCWHSNFYEHLQNVLTTDFQAGVAQAVHSHSQPHTNHCSY